LHSTKIPLIFVLSKTNQKSKVMKKLFFAIYTISLVALAPAVFAGYLYNGNTATVAKKEVKIEKAKVLASTEVEEAGYAVKMLVAIR
jgi:hypothetical protein